MSLAFACYGRSPAVRGLFPAVGCRRHSCRRKGGNDVRQISCLTVPYLAYAVLHMTFPAVPCLALPCLAVPCLALSYTWPCAAVPCLALPCPGLHISSPCRTADFLSYDAIYYPGLRWLTMSYATTDYLPYEGSLFPAVACRTRAGYFLP